MPRVGFKPTIPGFERAKTFHALCGPYTINHVAQNCFAQHKFANSRSSQSAPYTVNHVAQHAMLRNMIDREWAPLDLAAIVFGTVENSTVYVI
jgi:hypothetical protein